MSAILAGKSGQDSCHRPDKLIVAEHLGSVIPRVASKVGMVLEQKALTGTKIEIETAVILVVGVK